MRETQSTSGQWERRTGLAGRTRRHHPSDSGRDRWLLTYADLITLLLALFVVMYSMSQMDKQKFAEVSQALSGVFNARSTTIKTYSENEELTPGGGPLRFSKYWSMKRALDNKAYEKGVDTKKFSSEVTERGLVIHLMDNAIFSKADATLSAEAMDVLDIVAAELLRSVNQIRVEGHTDNLPIHSSAYATNWELSTSRATVVARYLIDAHGLDPRRLSAIGFAEFRPVVPNATEENRARNRRVDIVILNKDLSDQEPTPSLFLPLFPDSTKSPDTPDTPDSPESLESPNSPSPANSTRKS